MATEKRDAWVAADHRGTPRLRLSIFALAPIRHPISGEAFHVAEPVELLVEGSCPSRTGQEDEDPSPEGTHHRRVEAQRRAEHGTAAATDVDFPLRGIELELLKIALAHRAPNDTMHHHQRGIVDDATAVLERSIDQLDLLPSIELAAHAAALVVQTNR